ncbi:integrase [Morganella morganii]|uniref:Integrase n=1 Tax=Morganella morganii TaxID=582 RepID=A0AAU8ZPP8_MORMO|nr:integrase [Morganella morganii]
MGSSSEMRDRLQNHRKPSVSSKYYERYDYLMKRREIISYWEKNYSLYKNLCGHLVRTDHAYLG